LEVAPQAALYARQNRSFLARAVRHLATDAGIDQFLDIGTGLPTVDNVHQIAQRCNPAARVVYVDRDPVVLTHARALLAADANTGVVAADMRAPGAILADPEARALLDVSRPVGVLFVSVLHFVPGGQAAPIVGWFHQELAAGSHVVISHAQDRPQIREAVRLYRDAVGAGTVRTRERITAL